MISPSSETSTVLQFNMGEGKSSVIVPLTAAYLADSKKLVRVIVLKSLAGQMFQTLVARMSGLVNRRIFYLPFSRRNRLTGENATLIQALLHQCARAQGVLVAQPEHILSFRLLCMDRTLSPSSSTSRLIQTLQGTQTWLTENTRDILDESDELLHVRYQLIYTSGQQQPLDDSPDRWATIAQVLERVRLYSKVLRDLFPNDVLLLPTPEGSFPSVRITGRPAFEACVTLLANDALNGVLDNIILPGLGANRNIRSAAFRFLTSSDIPHIEWNAIQRECKGLASWKGLLLLRGLLAHGILEHILRLRWRVDYGPDYSRSLMAVPYRAKVRCGIFTVTRKITDQFAFHVGRSKPKGGVWPSRCSTGADVLKLLLWWPGSGPAQRVRGFIAGARQPGGRIREMG